jgi:hypothetical protein
MISKLLVESTIKNEQNFWTFFKPQVLFSVMLLGDDKALSFLRKSKVEPSKNENSILAPLFYQLEAAPFIF